MPSVASQFPGSLTVVAQPGSVGIVPFVGPLPNYRNNNATSGSTTERPDMSWPWRQPAVPDAFLPPYRPTDTTNGYPYPTELDISSGPLGLSTDHGGHVARPSANNPGQSPPFPRPQLPQPPVQRFGTQNSNEHNDSRHQSTDQRLPTYGSSATTTDHHNNHPRYGHQAPLRRRRDS